MYYKALVCALMYISCVSLETGPEGRIQKKIADPGRIVDCVRHKVHIYRPRCYLPENDWQSGSYSLATDVASTVCLLLVEEGAKEAYL